MKITLSYAEILFDLQTKNREEVRSIQDPRAKYFAEAGSEKMSDIVRCIHEASLQVRSLCARFINHQRVEDASNIIEPKETDVIDFDFSERRALGKGPVLAQTLHSLIVNHALSKFYNNVQQPDLASKRAQLAADDTKLLNKLLYEKLEPVYPRQ